MDKFDPVLKLKTWVMDIVTFRQILNSVITMEEIIVIRLLYLFIALIVFAIHIQLKVHIVLAVTQVQTTLDLSFTYLVILCKYVVNELSFNKDL